MVVVIVVVVERIQRHPYTYFGTLSRASICISRSASPWHHDDNDGNEKCLGRSFVDSTAKGFLMVKTILWLLLLLWLGWL